MKYVEESELFRWYKPLLGLMGSWAATGHAAIRVAEATSKAATKEAEDVFAVWLNEQTEPLIADPERVNGRVIMRSAARTSVFADFYVDLVLAAYPDARFTLTPDRAHAHVDSEPVALIMRRRETEEEAAAADPIGDRPVCCTCGGSGKWAREHEAARGAV